MKRYGKQFFFLCIFSGFVSQHAHSQSFDIEEIQSGCEASFRALSVVNDSVAWVGGSKGTIGRSTNGGRNWRWAQVAGSETMDFRSIYAFDSLHAVIANAGSPATIHLTKNGGKSWQLVYQNDDPLAFFDGVDFWDAQNGIIYGDPIGGKMLVLITKNGGASWEEVASHSTPRLEKGEASFAASGTCIRCFPNHTVIIATGGMRSRLWTSTNGGHQWNVHETPVLQGTESAGIFSFTYATPQEGILVGGRWDIDTLRHNHVFYTKDGGRTWQKPHRPTMGYRECVELILPGVALAVGPTGMDVSMDNGRNWAVFSSLKGYHTVRKARNGKLILVVGSRGKVAVCKQKPGRKN